MNSVVPQMCPLLTDTRVPLERPLHVRFLCPGSCKTRCQTKKSPKIKKLSLSFSALLSFFPAIASLYRQLYAKLSISLASRGEIKYNLFTSTHEAGSCLLHIIGHVQLNFYKRKLSSRNIRGPVYEVCCLYVN